MESPLVSICVPCYNGGVHLIPALRSALAQSYPNLEVVYVDDCSKDNSYSEALALARENSRLRVIRNEKNLGMQGNWNAAVAHCRGEFIKLLCADDLLSPAVIERQVRILQENPELVLVTSDSAVVDGCGRGVFHRRCPLPRGRRISRAEVLESCIKSGTNVIGEPSIVLMRATAVRSAGAFSKDYKYAPDIDHVLSLLRYGDAWVDSYVGASFRMHPGSLTHEGLQRAEGELLAIFRSHAGDMLVLDEAAILRRIRQIRDRKALFIRLLNNRLSAACLRLVYRMSPCRSSGAERCPACS